MDSDGTFNLGGAPVGASQGAPPSPCLPSITHLVGVDGHAGGEPDHRDAVEARGVGDGCGGEMVAGLGRVTHQDGVDLQRHGGGTIHQHDTAGTASQRFISPPSPPETQEQI